MASTWMYGCEKGLQQDTCDKYKADEESRGHNEGWNGCPSCTHREPANTATATADAGHAAD